MRVSYALFDTPIGTCGLAWGARGIVGAQLPEGSAVQSRERFVRRFPGATEAAPTEAMAHAAREITALMNGEKRDLLDLKLDYSAIAPFHQTIYDLARAIPPGQTRSYGELARAAGDVNAAQAVGQAMAKNRFPIIVPCHRVLAADGKMGGFSARGGVTTKLALLKIEGWRPEAPDLFDTL